MKQIVFAFLFEVSSNARCRDQKGSTSRVIDVDCAYPKVNQHSSNSTIQLVSLGMNFFFGLLH